MAIRLFEGEEHAKLYAKYRPVYPDTLYEKIFEYCSAGTYDKSPSEVAVDIGCGPGQSTWPLCRYFRQVIGSDVSEYQITCAKSKTASADGKTYGNITFRVSPGEDLSFLEDSSVDLITVAQALHWLERDAFYAEVKRVLKPNGVFAAYGHGVVSLDEGAADKIQQEFYFGLLGDYWAKEVYHSDNLCRDLKFPFEPITRIESENVSLRRRMPLSAYIGYVKSWSAWQTYNQVHPGSRELQVLHEKLHSIYSKKSDLQDPILEVYEPGFLVLSRKPG